MLLVFYPSHSTILKTGINPTKITKSFGNINVTIPTGRAAIAILQSWNSLTLDSMRVCCILRCKVANMLTYSLRSVRCVTSPRQFQMSPDWCKLSARLRQNSTWTDSCSPFRKVCILAVTLCNCWLVSSKDGIRGNNVF